jgi:hypothetical protein
VPAAGVAQRALSEPWNTGWQGGGNVLAILTVGSWTTDYPHIPDGTLTASAERPAARTAADCLNQRRASASSSPAHAARRRRRHRPGDRSDVGDPPRREHARPERRRDAGVRRPGLADEIIAAEVTTEWVADRCATDVPTVFHTSPDVDHPAVVGPGGTDALSWTIDRFAGTTPPDEYPAG